MKTQQHVAAILLLVAVAVAVCILIARLIYTPPAPPQPCTLRVDAILVNETGVYLWLSTTGCKVTVDGGYLEYPDGGLAARLQVIAERVVRSSATVVRMLPDTIVEPGEYILEVSYRNDPVVAARVYIPRPLPAAVIARSVSPGATLVLEAGGFRVEALVEASAAGVVVHVSVCPPPAGIVRGLRVEAYDERLRLIGLNATGVRVGSCAEATLHTPTMPRLLVVLVYGSPLGPKPSCLCVYYGEATSEAAKALWGCRMLVLSPLVDPSIFNPSAAKLGYLSITTVGGWEPWAKLVTDDLVVGYDPTWGEKVVNACDKRWWLIVDKAVDYILSRGFNGVFLDNLDKVDEYPWMKECVAALVRHVREEHPNITIVVNRGFTILAEIAPYIDGLLVEDYPTYYDFNTGEYRAWSGDELQWYIRVIHEAETLSAKYGFGIYLLAYWDTSDPKAEETICKLLDATGVHHPTYIATIDLAKPGFCAACG